MDPVLRLRVDRLHDVLARRTEDLEAESRLALIGERLREQLRRHRRAHPGAASPDSTGNAVPARRPDRKPARQLRDLLDSRIQRGVTLAEAARQLHSHPTHLVRTFSREYGLPPHLYLTGRRVELARRHFKRMLGVSPARFAIPDAR